MELAKRVRAREIRDAIAAEAVAFYLFDGKSRKDQREYFGRIETIVHAIIQNKPMPRRSKKYLNAVEIKSMKKSAVAVAAPVQPVSGEQNVNQ